MQLFYKHNDHIPTLPSLTRALSLSKPSHLDLESLWISVFPKSTMERFDIAGRLVSISRPFVTFRGDIRGVRLGVGIDMDHTDIKASCGGGIDWMRQAWNDLRVYVAVVRV